MSWGGERLMRCGHAMRHSELEPTVRAPAIKVKGCHLFGRFSLRARCRGHHL